MKSLSVAFSNGLVATIFALAFALDFALGAGVVPPAVTGVGVFGAAGAIAGVTIRTLGACIGWRAPDLRSFKANQKNVESDKYIH